MVVSPASWHVVYLAVISMQFAMLIKHGIKSLIDHTPVSKMDLALNDPNTQPYPYWNTSIVHCHANNFLPNSSFYTQPSHSSSKSNISSHSKPIVTVKRFLEQFSDRTCSGHIAYINDPSKTLSILEPSAIGGCDLNIRATVSQSAKQHHCLLAVNAGFFNKTTEQCYGNVVSNGRLVKKSSRHRNANFGIRRDGTLVFGYLTNEDIEDQSNPFIQLVGGIGWIVRDGHNYVEESKHAECGEPETLNGITIVELFNSISARTAIASDRDGRLMIVQIDGRSDLQGITVQELAEFLIKHGAVNALNLDGGGSATFVSNGMVINYPSDYCEDPAFRCSRPVSTIMCIHEPECNSPSECNEFEEHQFRNDEVEFDPGYRHPHARPCKTDVNGLKRDLETHTGEWFCRP